MNGERINRTKKAMFGIQLALLFFVLFGLISNSIALLWNQGYPIFFMFIIEMTPLIIIGSIFLFLKPQSDFLIGLLAQPFQCIGLFSINAYGVMKTDYMKDIQLAIFITIISILISLLLKSIIPFLYSFIHFFLSKYGSSSTGSSFLVSSRFSEDLMKRLQQQLSPGNSLMHMRFQLLCYM